MTKLPSLKVTENIPVRAGFQDTWDIPTPDTVVFKQTKHQSINQSINKSINQPGYQGYNNTRHSSVQQTKHQSINQPTRI